MFTDDGARCRVGAQATRRSTPAGLSLNPTTGSITGTPTTDGAYSFTVTAANSAGSTDQAFSGTVLAAPVAPTEFSPTTISTATVGSSYDYTIGANGSPAPTYAVTLGALPAGLSLNPTTGAITGTPTTAGAYSFTVTATNASGSTEQAFSGTVLAAAVPAGGTTATAPSSFTTTTIVSATVGSSYDYTVSANGSPAPTYAVTSGALPAGLSLNPTTGEITGTPTTAGAYSFTVTATNSAGSTSQAFSGTVQAGPWPPPVSPPRQFLPPRWAVLMTTPSVPTGPRRPPTR